MGITSINHNFSNRYFLNYKVWILPVLLLWLYPQNMFKKESRDGSGDDGKALTPFQAISIAIGGTIGVSNMSGVATAIAVGGPVGASVATAMRLGFARSVYSNEAGWFTYYSVILKHWLGNNKKVLKVAEKIFILGTPAQLWTICDFTTIVPTFVNVITLFMLSGTFVKLLKDYKARCMGIGQIDPDVDLFYEEKKKINKLRNKN